MTPISFIAAVTIAFFQVTPSSGWLPQERFIEILQVPLQGLNLVAEETMIDSSRINRNLKANESDETAEVRGEIYKGSIATDLLLLRNHIVAGKSVQKQHCSIPSKLELCTTIRPNTRTPRQLYANIDWTLPQYYDTSKAILVGTKLYYISRGVDGLFISELDTTTNTWRSLPQYQWMTDTDGWNLEKHYATIRVATIGSALYVFGRGVAGTYLSSYDTVNGIWTLLPSFAFLTDANGFTLTAYYKTVKMVACGTSLYVTARSSAGINIASFNTATSTWTLRPTANQFTDDTVWTQVKYYDNVKLACNNFVVWFFIRGSDGIKLIDYSTTTNTWRSSVLYTVYYTDTNGFANPVYYETIDIVFLNGMLCVPSRGSASMYVRCLNLSTLAFSDLASPAQFTSPTWSVPKQYQTVRYIVTGNRLFAIGRYTTNVVLYSYVTNAWTIMATSATFTDAAGWDQIYAYRTINSVLVGNYIYEVGRKQAGVQLSVYSIAGNTWTSVSEFFYPCYNSCKQCSGSTSASCTSCTSLNPLASLSPAVAPASCVCPSHNYLSAADGYCYACHQSCVECSGGTTTTCTACTTNGQLVTPPTSACKCTSGFFFDATFACSPCHQQCKECTGATQLLCSQCFAAAHLVTSPISACTCDSGNYLDGSYQCHSCFSTCQECNGANFDNCTLCKTNAQLSTPPISDCRCVTGYYMDSGSNCAKCDSSCLKCIGSAANQCTDCPSHSSLLSPPTSVCQCFSSYFFDSTSGSCLACDHFCTECSGQASNMCTACTTHGQLVSPPTSACKCTTGYFFDSNFACSPCHQQCKECTGATQFMCSQCFSAAHLVSPPISDCVCDSGNFMDSSNQCVPCYSTCAECIGDGIDMCTLCKTSAELTSPSLSECACITGFYMNGLSVCAKCDSSCLKCIGPSANQCTDCASHSSLYNPPTSACQCVSSYVFDVASSSCLACDISCKDCSGQAANQCTACKMNATLVSPPTSACKCASGFFFDATFNCSPCHQQCKECTGTTQLLCSQCFAAAHLVTSPISACTCDSGNYLDGSYQCHSCFSTCQECNGANFDSCTLCKTNAQLSTPPISDCRCVTGYYMDSGSNCAKCDSSCLKCIGSAANQCTDCFTHASLLSPPTSICQCDSSYFFDSASSSCSACDPSCKECSGQASTLCTACNTNSQLVSPPVSACECAPGFKSMGNSCISCFKTCLLCSGSSPSECLSCQSNLSLLDTPPSFCGCQLSYYLDNSQTCLSCPATCIQCLGPSECTQCISNASLQSDKSCKCDQSYYWNDASKECSECDQSCRDCSGGKASNCISCNNGAVLVASECVCYEGWFQSNSICLQCRSLCANCISELQCEKCGENAILKKALCECETGYYFAAGSNKCASCQFGCAKCSEFACLECDSNRYFLNGNCLDSCPSDYTVNNGKNCAQKPPTPSLELDPSNSLSLSFSKPITKNLQPSDLLISVYDLDDQSYSVTWSVATVSDYQSFNVSFAFESSAPPSNSTLMLEFRTPTDIHDANGTQVSENRLSVVLSNVSPQSATNLTTPRNSPAANTAAAAAQGAVSSAAVISVIGGNPTALFGLLNQLQLITYIPLMGIDLPDEFASTLIGLNSNSFAVNPMVYFFSSAEKGTTPSKSAQKYGFTTTLFLLNSGFLVFSATATFVSFLVLLTLSKINALPSVAAYSSQLLSKFHWSIPVRLWIQLYLDIGINAILQFSSLSQSSLSLPLLINYVVSGVLLLLFTLTPIITVRFLFAHRRLITDRSDEAFNTKWGVFFMEFEANCGSGMVFFYANHLLRRCVYGMLLMAISSAPVAQISLSLLFSATVSYIQTCGFLFVYRPYEQLLDFVGALSLEITTFAVFGLTSTFLVVSKTIIRDRLAMIGKIIIFSSIGCNSIFSLLQTGKTIKNLIIQYKLIVEKMRKAEIRSNRKISSLMARPRMAFVF